MEQSCGHQGHKLKCLPLATGSEYISSSSYQGLDRIAVKLKVGREPLFVVVVVVVVSSQFAFAFQVSYYLDLY